MLAWIDCETTGLDASRDTLLEIGLEITDDELRRVHIESFVVAVYDRHAIQHMDHMIRDMHTKNGLLAALATGWDVNAIDSQLSAVMSTLCVTPPPMCGSSVHFDKYFLAKHLPKFSAMFHYRCIDTSSVKELVRRWKPDILTDNIVPRSRKLHRVVPDIEDTLEEAEFYKQYLF